MSETDLGLWAVPLAVLAGAIRVGTPFLFVSIGECLTEKSGRINLGLEGNLVLGAMAGYGISYLSGSPWLGVLVAALALLAATTGFCAGCEAYKLGHLLTGRRFVSCPIPPRPAPRS